MQIMVDLVDVKSRFLVDLPWYTQTLGRIATNGVDQTSQYCWLIVLWVHLRISEWQMPIICPYLVYQTAHFCSCQFLFWLLSIVKCQCLVQQTCLRKGKKHLFHSISHISQLSQQKLLVSLASTSSAIHHTRVKTMKFMSTATTCRMALLWKDMEGLTVSVISYRLKATSGYLT
jgi:hypothetical protein